jgi:acetolactate synthase-1/3 small subunit
MAEQKPMVMKHVIAALVTNEPGVLAQVAGMFAARGFNIDSLVVGRTENPEFSRMTIVVSGDDAVLEQVRKQLQKLVPVVKVVDYKDVSFVERDLMLVQVWTTGPAGGDASGAAASTNEPSTSSKSNHCRSELIELANLFRAKVVDVSPDKLMIELSGTEEKLEAFIELIQPYGIIELARTGVIAMPRGHMTGRSRTGLSRSSMARGDIAGGPSDIDPTMLPPG